MKHDSINTDTLSLAIDDLNRLGYTENFKAEENTIKALYSKKEYQPEALLIVEVFRFEGMTNPSDQAELLVIVANDGLKGTLTASYSAESNQNDELIRRIRKK